MGFGDGRGGEATGTVSLLQRPAGGAERQGAAPELGKFGSCDGSSVIVLHDGDEMGLESQTVKCSELGVSPRRAQLKKRQLN